MMGQNDIESRKSDSRFWDRHYKQFRILIIIFSVIIFSALAIDSYRNATTVFTGTHYMRLPSKFYVAKTFSAQYDTVLTGSFLLQVNGKIFDSLTQIKEFYEGIGSDSLVKLVFFNHNKAKYLEDEDEKKKFVMMSDTIIAKKSDFNDSYLLQLDSGTYIALTIPNGATFNAGVKSGDVLLAIKGVSLKFREELPYEMFTTPSLRYLRSLPLNEHIPFLLLRNNQLIVKDVTLNTYGVRTIHLLLIIYSLIFLCFGAFLGIKESGNIGIRLTSLAFLIIAFQFATSLNYNPPDYDAVSFIKIMMTNILGIFMLSVIIHSLNYFPSPNEKIINKKIYITVIYSVILVLVAVLTVWFIIDFEKIIGTIFFAVMFGLVLFYIVLRIIKRNKNAPAEYRRASVIIFSTWLIITMNSFVIGLFYRLGVKFPQWFSEYNFLLMILIPVSYFFVLRRYGIYGIDFHIKRNVQYNLLSVFLYLVLFIAFVFILGKLSQTEINFPYIRFSFTDVVVTSSLLSQDANIIYNKIFFMLCSLVIAFILLKIGKYSQNFINKIYYRQKLDYRRAQNELINLIQTKFTIDSLAIILVEKITKLVRLKKAGAIFFDEKGQIWENKIYVFDNKNCELEIPQDLCRPVKILKTYFPVEGLPDNCSEYFIENKFKYVFPVKIKEKLLGALFTGEKLSEIQMKEEDFSFVTSLMSNAAVAIENAFLYEELRMQERMKNELEVARKIQLASLPQKVPEIPDLDICAVSFPAYEVGGDFYDFLNGTADEITVVVGDVSGKGTSAALYMSKIQGIFQTLKEFYPSPRNMLTKANQLLYKHIDSKSYITAIGANFSIKEKKISFARAGHLPLYHYNTLNSSVVKIQPGGIGLGLGDDDIFNNSIEEISVNYNIGDIFVFVSDGITEAINKDGEQFGDERLKFIITSNNVKTSKEICRVIIESVNLFTSNMKQFDDMTLVIVKSVS